MPGISPKLPLQYDEIDGHYSLNKTYEEVIKQNFKMLILTNPGERIMDSKYGVGITGYLFENASNIVYQDIQSRIEQQTANYLPFIRIESIEINDTTTNSDIDQNQVNITINYEILPLRKNDTLKIVV